MTTILNFSGMPPSIPLLSASSQSCYNSNGNIDDYTPAMGAWNYFPPGADTQLHMKFDVVSHLTEDRYGQGLMQIISAAPYIGNKK